MTSTTKNGGEAAIVTMSLVIIVLVVLSIIVATSGSETNVKQDTIVDRIDRNGQITVAAADGIKCYLTFREANPNTVASVGVKQLDECFKEFDQLAKER